MIDILIFGFLRKKIDPKASLAGDMKIQVEHSKGIKLLDILNNIKIEPQDFGECFIDGVCVKPGENPLIKDGSRIGIFSEGMYLLCGGQHLKGHGFITKPSPKKYNYFNTDS